MLTSDELEFGYQVWRENPDCLVGYVETFYFILIYVCSKSFKHCCLDAVEIDVLYYVYIDFHHEHIYGRIQTKSFDMNQNGQVK